MSARRRAWYRARASWANHQTHVEVEKLLEKISKLAFKKSESPNRWNLKMQEALET